MRDRLVGCVGVLVGIGMAGFLCSLIFGSSPQLPLLVAPIGASAVLLFAVPASPLAQPWPIIGGNVISAFTGLLIAGLIPDPTLAAGTTVALAIAVMSLARCLHPPGGAVALATVLGGPAVAKWGVLFPLIPVGLNSCILVALGLLFHRLTRKTYPHVAAPASATLRSPSDPLPWMRPGFAKEDIDAALEKLDETFDIDRGDLEQILREVELQTVIRAHGELRCADIMSRDVICIHSSATKREARALLQQHGVRLLPVTGDDGRLLGTVGLREVMTPGGSLADVLFPALTTSPSARAAELLPALTDGKWHAAIVTDEDKHVLGLISRTDLLRAVGRLSTSKPDDARKRSAPPHDRLAA